MFKRLTYCLLALFVSLSLSPVPLHAFEPSPEDQALLNKIEKDTFQYFTRFSDKITGLTKDSSRPGSPSSVAATGFALAAYAIGGSRGWIAQDYAYTRILTTLQTLRHKAAHQEGFFYHFLDVRTGKRVLLAIEPMVTEGHYAVEMLEDDWTVITKDRKNASHYEDSIAFTEDGFINLTSDGVI